MWLIRHKVYLFFFYVYISVCAQSCGRKTHRSTAERLAVTQVLLQATVWKARQCLSLFRRCVKPYVYAVFLQLSCESIPSRQRFHLEDKLITAREFNAHVRPGVRVQYARTILMTKLASHTLYAVHRVQSEVYFVRKVFWTIYNSFVRNSDLSDLSTSNIACIAIQKFGSVRKPDYLIKNTVKHILQYCCNLKQLFSIVICFLK